MHFRDELAQRPAHPAAAGHIVTFVVTADDDSTPIEITYPGFTPSESGRATNDHRGRARGHDPHPGM